eukprot:5853-Heterococcus_DN1.PRE.6
MSESAAKRKGEGEDGKDVKKVKAEAVPAKAEDKQPRRLPTAGRKCMPRDSEGEYEEEEEAEEEEDREEAPAPKAKKAKAAKKGKASDDGVVISLGGTRQVTVKAYKGKPLIDIREFYNDKSTGELKPGKKGISLTSEQYIQLKSSLSEIDDALAEIE